MLSRIYSKFNTFLDIDFGHFLGNVNSLCKVFAYFFKVKSKFGVKRERAPFKFTQQYAFILGGKGSPAFKKFQEVCCNAYNTLRRETDLFITLFSLVSQLVVIIWLPSRC